MNNQAKNENVSIISLRMEKIRETIGISAKEYAEKLGTNYRTYMNYKSGSTPSAQVLQSVVEIFGISAQWLLTGKGHMFLKDALKAEKQDMDCTQLVPVLSQIQAGPNGRFVADHPLYYLPRPIGVKESVLYAFEVMGDSMFPVYKPGDVVFGLPVSVPRSGEDVVAQIDWNGDQDELVLKRWHRIGDNVSLHSLNKEYLPIQVESTQVKGIARIVALMWAKQVMNAKISTEDYTNSLKRT